MTSVKKKGGVIKMICIYWQEGFLAAKCSTVPLEFYSGGEKKGYRFSYKGSYVTIKTMESKFFRRNDCVGKCGLRVRMVLVSHRISKVIAMMSNGLQTLKRLNIIRSKGMFFKDSPKRKG